MEDGTGFEEPPLTRGLVLSVQTDAKTAQITMQLAHQVFEVLYIVHRLDPEAAIAGADRFLESSFPTCPEAAPFYESIPSEAKFFATAAFETVAGELFSALLERFCRKLIHSRSYRKRLFWDIWKTLSSKERDAFFAKVEHQTTSVTESG